MVLKKTPILKRPAFLPKYLGYNQVRNSNPLIHPKRGNYCSSVNVRYKGSFYTLTNAHCCASTAEGRFLKEVLVRGSVKVRNVLRVDERDDVCVLDNPEMQGVSISSVPAKKGDILTSLGYPLGGELRVFTGKLRYYKNAIQPGCHPLLALEKKCPKRVRGILKVKVAPGSSGSPVFNQYGQLVGLVHAMDWNNPNDIIARMITLNQFKYQLELAHDSN